MAPSTALENSRMHPGRILLVAAELALAVYVIWIFELVPSGEVGKWLFALVPVFALHALLPLPWRLPFSLAVTVGLIYLTLSLTAGLYLILLGLLLIGLCHLPCRYLWRLLAIIVVVTLFALLQSRILPPGKAIAAALPLLGALFMFRLIIYLYDIRHEKPGTVTVWQRLGYFFLLPAPVFAFFPTLDYRVYLRCHYARPAFGIAQTGVLWISRGITHLILYRFIYHEFSPSPGDVVDLGGVMAYCLSGYLIYLRVSGVFHIIGGTLRLFGYDLPDTHRLYFFASGFSDYWRRINIYWKDFMAKILFFPTFGALRALGIRARIAVATGVVFIGTTILHSYQTFWLRGDFAIHETDYWFWGILGVLVIINNLMDDKKRSTKRLGTKTPAWNASAAAMLSLRTVGMFIFLCFLWALWSSQTLGKFFGVMRQAAHFDGNDLAVLGGFIALAVVLGTLGQYIASRGFHLFEVHPGPARAVATTVLPLLLCAAAWNFQTRGNYDGSVGNALEKVCFEQPNLRDEEATERSYYEGLLSRPAAGDYNAEQQMKRTVADVREELYQDSVAPRRAFEATWSTNRWGMRDQGYRKRKLAGVYRIAFSGASYTMGRGVDDGLNFESVLEKHLTDHGMEIESLNFGMSDTATFQRLADLELRILDFQPDVFVVVCHDNESGRSLRKIVELVNKEHDLTFPWLKDIVARSGIQPGDEPDDARRALLPFSDEIMRLTYTEIARVCEENAITPVWVFLPLTRWYKQTQEAEESRQFADAAGLVTIVLDDVYRGLDPLEVSVSAQDNHPNALGHRYIARRLLEKMRESRATLSLPEDIDRIGDIEVGKP